MNCRKVWYWSILILSMLFLSGCANIRLELEKADGEVKKEENEKANSTKKEEKIYIFKKDRMFNAAVDAFFAAVDAKDAQAIKELFSQKALAEAENLDEEIEELFKETFGEPNAVTCPYLAYAYELPDEDGEKRYIQLYVSEEQKITKAMLENDVDIVYLELLWEAEKEERK